MRGASVEPDAEVYSWYREYMFRKVFGGGHVDYMGQPVEATDWLLAIHGRLSDQSPSG